MACETKSQFVVDEAIYEAIECTSCADEIPVGSIQLGVRVQSDDEDNMTHWYHLSCFFNKYQPKSIADIDGFDFISQHDREEIMARIDQADGGSPSSSDASGTSIEESTSEITNGKHTTRCKPSKKQSRHSLDKLFKQKLKFSNQSSSESSDEDESGLDYILGLEDKKSKLASMDHSDSESDFDDEDIVSVRTTDSNKPHRRRIINEENLDVKTKRVATEEKARKKRLAKRRASLPHIYEAESLVSQLSTVEKLVLDYDENSETELVTVHPLLLKKLKLHQMKGVRFMWDSCFESLQQVKKRKGGGCILAHCMGLGKTLQVITLVHTLLRHPATTVKNILILCPLSTVLNWKSEFEKWLSDLDDWDKIGSNIFELTKSTKNANKAKKLEYWNKHGGVMILGYDSFRSLVNSQKIEQKMRAQIRKALLKPGPQLVICDEGHLLKNEKTALSKATMEIETLRRIALTGTPLQNNLVEYYCMVQFVKPYLLGNKREFTNRFAYPIEDGQFVDCDALQVKLMKERALVLHEMLEGIVQRFDYGNVLKPLLPPKFEFVISVGLSDLQTSLYETFLANLERYYLFGDYNQMRLIWTHPLVMKLSVDRNLKIQKKEEKANDSINSSFVGTAQDEWWQDYVSDAALKDYTQGPKMILLFAILKECQRLGDKLLIFSQSILTLDVIEYFLSQSILSSCGIWRKNIDYFRLDGQTKNELRSHYCGIFNRSNNVDARLFLISTKAGGLGINLTAANRVIIFDASWNPSFDIQSIFRVCRVGQKKPCYIYRFLSQGTMEEKIYDRQVTKLSVSGRVVDDQQISRHFSRKDIEELYIFNRKPPLKESTEILKIPNDAIMAELLKEHKDVIISYHEHDSLLEDVVEEKLTEAERKAAWKDYKGKAADSQQRTVPNTPRKIGTRNGVPDEQNLDR